ncbi:MAG: MFS transporter [Chloroflexi bacterium]|nr:MFS transporter [Chloroflexota bacterium]
MKPETDGATRGAGTSAAAALSGLTLGLLVASYFLRYINSNLQGPLLVQWAQEFHTSVAMIGQITVAITLPWGLAAPLLGPFSDRYGRRPLLLIGLALAGLSSALTALAWDYPSLLFFRFLAGVGGAASAPTAIAIIGDQCPFEKRGRPLGLLFAGEALGALAGIPAVTWVAGTFGWKVAFLVEGALYVPVVVGYLLLVKSPAWVPRSTGWLGDIGAVVRERHTNWLMLLNGLVQVSFFAADTFLPAFLMLTYHLSVADMAPVLLVLAIGNLLGALGGGPFADRFPRYAGSALLALTTGLLGLAVMFLTSNLWLSIGLAAAYRAVHYAYRPVYTCIISQASAHLRGTVLGLNGTSNNVGTSAGSALGGVVLSLLGYPPLGIAAFVISLVPSIGMPLLAKGRRPADQA